MRGRIRSLRSRLPKWLLSVWQGFLCSRRLPACFSAWRAVLQEWAALIGVGTEDAAVTWFGSQQSFAVGALVEEDAAVGWHLFLRLFGADGAGERDCEVGRGGIVPAK